MIVGNAGFLGLAIMIDRVLKNNGTGVASQAEVSRGGTPRHDGLGETARPFGS
jgi:hypothetical protein